MRRPAIVLLSGSLVMLGTAGISQAQPTYAAEFRTTSAASRLPALSLFEAKAEPATVAPGGAVKFTVTVKNSGPDDANNVKVVHTLSANLEDIASTSPGCTPGGGKVTCNLTKVAKTTGAQALEVTAKVKAGTADQAPVTDDMSMTSDEITTPVTGQAKSTVATAPVLALDAPKADPAQPAPKGQVKFTVTAKNTGAKDATNVEVTHTLSDKLENAKSTTAGCAPAGGKMKCTFAKLDKTSGAQAMEVTADVKDATADGTKVTDDIAVTSAEVTTPVKAQAKATVKVPKKLTKPAIAKIGGKPVNAGAAGKVTSTKPKIEGTGGEISGTITVYQEDAGAKGKPDKSKQLCATAKLTVKGPWDCTPGTDLTAGTDYTAVAVQAGTGATDSDPSEAATFTVVEKPAKPVIAKIGGKDASTGDVGELASGTPEIEGTDGLPGAELTVYQDNGSGKPDPNKKVCTESPVATDAWSCAPASALADGTYKVVAVQTEDSVDSDPSDAVSFSVKVPPQAKLTLTEPKADPDKQEIGEYISFTSKLTATDDIAGDTTVVHTLTGPVEQVEAPAGPGDNAGCTATGLVVTCKYQNLKKGDTKTPSITATVKAGAKAGEKINDVVTADATGSAQAKAEIPAEVKAAAEAKAKVTLTGETTAKAGEDVSVDLGLENTGSIPAGDPVITNPEVTVTLPDALAFKSADSGKCNASGQTVTCAYTGTTLSAVKPETASLSDKLTLTVKKDATKDGKVDAKMTKPAVTKPPEASSQFTLIKEPKLEVKTDPDALGSVPAGPGNAVDVKVTLTNNGNADATSAGYTYTAKNASNVYFVGEGCSSETPNSFTCVAGDLSPKASSSVVTFRTAPDAKAVDQNLEITVTPTLAGKDQPGAAKLSGKIVKAGALKMTVSPASLDKVVAGDTQEIKATLENEGATEVADPSLEAYFHKAAEFAVKGDQAAKCKKQSGSYKCDFDPLAPKGKIALTFNASPDVKFIGKEPFEANLTANGGAGDDQRAKLKAEIVSPLKLTASAEPESAKVGDVVKYTAKLTNIGASEVQNAAIVHTLTDNLKPTKVQAPCTIAGQTVQCQHGKLAGDESTPAETGVIEATVQPEATGDLIDTVTASASVPASDNDFVKDKTEAKVTGPVPANADLAVAASVRPDPVKPGDKLRHTVTVENKGPDTAHPSKLTFELAGPVDSVKVGGPCKANKLEVTCDVPELKAGTQAWGIGITATATDDAGDVTGTATVKPSSDTKDPDPSNNTAKTTAKVVAAMDLQVDATGTPATAVAGKDWVNYSVSVLPLGPASEAKDVKLTGTLPAFAKTELVPEEMRRVKADDCKITGNELTCELGTVKLGDAVKKIAFKGLVAPDATGALKATFKATSANPVEDPSGETAEVSTATEPSADVAVSGKAGTLKRGKTGKYYFTVTNNGPSNSVKVSLKNKLPKYLTYYKVKTTGCKKSSNGIACSWATLKAGETIKVTLYVKVSKSKKAKTVYNTVDIASTTADPAPENNTAKIK